MADSAKKVFRGENALEYFFLLTASVSKIV